MDSTDEDFTQSSADVQERQRQTHTRLLQRISANVHPLNQTFPEGRFHFLDLAPVACEGAQVLVEDGFTACFVSQRPHPWNFNFYLFPGWVLGIIFRHCILFPLRAIGWTLGSLLVAIAFVSVQSFVKDKRRKDTMLRRILQTYCTIWIMSWSGVVRYHGIKPPKHKKNMVVATNHTTILDIVILMEDQIYAIIGQKQPGGIGFFQHYLLSCLGCVWFERKDANDRAYVARKISEHIADEGNNPLLVFPEGVCVNNEYCIQFKKGAFELGADVYPVAIKYNKMFCDPYWNSKTQSFARHVWNLMTAWSVVADVWYLEKQSIKPGETAAEFANRVKAMIAKKAGLIDVPWDGYLKYFQPSERFVQEKQRICAEQLKKLIELRRCQTPCPIAAPAMDSEQPSVMTPTI